MSVIWVTQPYPENDNDATAFWGFQNFFFYFMAQRQKKIPNQPYLVLT